MALTSKHLRTCAATAVIAAASLACMASEDGERATTGMCPEGETCSAATAMGLTFVGNAMYDTGYAQLGPILAGGTFDVGLRTRDGQPLPDWRVSVEDASVFSAVPGAGVFGAKNNAGEPLVTVDGFAHLRGAAAGTTYLRITDPSGNLYDRLELEVFEIDEVQVVLAQDSAREHLYAGCDEMVGVRLMAKNGETEIRTFDQDIIVRTNQGTIEEENRFWDCVLYHTPENATQATFTVQTAGRRFDRTLPIVELEADGLTECPPIRRD